MCSACLFLLDMFIVLFNVEPLEEFKLTTRIRQDFGNCHHIQLPSPYLFLVAAVGLSCALKASGPYANLEGFKQPHRRWLRVIYFFADDTLVYLGLVGKVL